MRKHILTFLIVLLTCLPAFAENIQTLVITAMREVKLPLIHKADLEYLGGFRLPADPNHPSDSLWGMQYPNKGVAFRPPSTGAPYGSLIVTGYFSSVAEIAIPDPETFSKASNNEDITRSPSALQGPVDPWNATVKAIYRDGIDGGPTPGGWLVVGDTLLGTLYDKYAYAPDQNRSHFKNSITSIGGTTAIGSYKPSTSSPFTGDPLARFIAGRMCTIPTEYQTLLGGDVLTGLSDVSIVSNTSFGFSAHAFWSDDIINNSDIDTTFEVTPLMYVASGETHPLYGYWVGNGPANEYYASSNPMGGIVFPKGSRSLLYFFRHGTGEQCYGKGTDDPTLHRKPTGVGSNIYCYDPDMSPKGQHSYPYVYRAMAFDADDLVKSKNGTLAHNEIIPYSYWNIEFSVEPDGRMKDIQGVAYDETRQIIYVGQQNADLNSTVFQAFKVNIPR